MTELDRTVVPGRTIHLLERCDERRTHRSAAVIDGHLDVEVAVIILFEIRDANHLHLEGLLELGGAHGHPVAKHVGARVKVGGAFVNVADKRCGAQRVDVWQRGLGQHGDGDGLAAFYGLADVAELGQELLVGEVLLHAQELQHQLVARVGQRRAEARKLVQEDLNELSRSVSGGNGQHLGGDVGVALPQRGQR